MNGSGGTFLTVNLIYLAIAASMVVSAFNFGGEGSIVPLVIGLPTLAMVLIALGRFFFPSRKAAAGSAADPAGEMMAVASWSRAGVIAGWLAGFFVLIFLIGFYPSVFLYTLAFLKIEGKTSWGAAAVTAVALWAVLYLSFDRLMGQALFPGIFFRALLPSL